MTIRLIALDLDGTTLRRDGTISPRTVAALRRAMAAGVQVSIATGRLHASAVVFAQRLGSNGPVISANGGLIRDRSGRTLLHRPLPPAAVAAAVAAGTARTGGETAAGALATGAQVELFAGQAIYVADPREKRHHQWERMRRANSWPAFTDAARTWAGCRVRSLAAAPAGRPEKLFIAHRDPVRLQALCDHVRAGAGTPLELTSSAPDNLELTASGVTKGSAVAWLAEACGIALDEVMVAGDSLNDLSMFDLNCFKVAMGNAEAVIKERASAITASHMDDGVARAVERYVLEEAAG